MCFLLEREAYFCKNTKKLQTETTFLQKNVCVAIKSTQQEALTIKKLQNCKCDKSYHFAGRLLMQKLYVLPAYFQNSDGRLKRKNGDKKKFGGDKCQTDGPMSDNSNLSMLQKVKF